MRKTITVTGMDHLSSRERRGSAGFAEVERGRDISQLEAELEQALVTAEDAQQQAARLMDQNSGLRNELQAARAALRSAEAQCEELRGALAKPLAPPPSRSQAEEELRVAVEELQVMTEELEHANDLLRQSACNRS